MMKGFGIGLLLASVSAAALAENPPYPYVPRHIDSPVMTRVFDYEGKVRIACSLLMKIGPLTPGIAPWSNTCASEASIHKFAQDPYALEWLDGLAAVYEAKAGHKLGSPGAPLLPGALPPLPIGPR